MSTTLRTCRAATALITSTVVLVGVGGTQLAAAESVTATEGVNIRSGPGTSYRVVGGLTRGQSITRLAKAKHGWVKVRFNGAAAYVSAAYLTTNPKNLPAPTTIYTQGVKIATVALNVRNSPSLGSKIVGYISEGQKVTLTGKLSRGFAEILYGGSRNWVSAQYLATSSTGLPRVIGTRVARADLDLRTSSGSGASVAGEVRKGTKLGVTGVIANGRAQIVYRNAIRWVTAKYLSNVPVSQPSAPNLPRVVGSRYATTKLNIRSSASRTYTLITEVSRGTRLSITGKISNGRAQIIFRGAVRWVTAAYLSKRKPSGTSGGSGGTGSTSGVSYAVERGLTANAIKVHRAALRAFPQIRTYYGVRPDSIPDHPSGHALDLMLPYSNYTSASARAFGIRVRNWARANARSLGIQYVIYDQHIWNVQRNSEGWRYMANRGSDSANHKNHVHITVY